MRGRERVLYARYGSRGGERSPGKGPQQFNEYSDIQDNNP